MGMTTTRNVSVSRDSRIALLVNEEHITRRLIGAAGTRMSKRRARAHIQEERAQQHAQEERT
eukprot:786965-Pyramimonas_sp.AAC.1